MLTDFHDSTENEQDLRAIAQLQSALRFIRPGSGGLEHLLVKFATELELHRRIAIATQQPVIFLDPLCPLVGLAQLFPQGIPVRFSEPTLIIDHWDCFEINKSVLRADQMTAIAQIYESANIDPSFRAYLEQQAIAAIPLDWTRPDWMAELEAFENDGGAA